MDTIGSPNASLHASYINGEVTKVAEKEQEF